VQIEKTQIEIEELKQSLEHDIKHKQHREEYDSLSKVIMELPSRAETQK
jgi:hypothetical protein